jgi:hypothetical protein
MGYAISRLAALVQVSNSFFVLDDYQTSTEHAHDLTALILLQHMHS